MQIGEIIGSKYELTRLLGEGGMGAVYEARHVQLGKRVALKFLHPEMMSNPEAVTRFMREAQAAANIGSEHIVDVLDVGDTPSGEPFLVMEYMEGEDLRTVLDREGRIEPQRAAEIVSRVCAGVQAAHNQGIVHRDLKPANVFLMRTDEGREKIKVVDFGVAMMRTIAGDDTPRLTATGSVLGTPYYMAPEQAQGKKGVDHRVDVYAAGVVLYELVAGRPPYDADTYNALIIQIATTDPAPLRQHRPEVSPVFEQIVLRAMARDADHRYPTMAALAEALDAFAMSTQAGYAPNNGLATTGAAAPAMAATGAGAPPLAVTGGASQSMAMSAQIPPGNAAQEGGSKKGLVIAVIVVAALVVGIGAAVAAYLALTSMRRSRPAEIPLAAVTTTAQQDGGPATAIPADGADLAAVAPLPATPDGGAAAVPENPTPADPAEHDPGPTQRPTATPADDGGPTKATPPETAGPFKAPEKATSPVPQIVPQQATPPPLRPWQEALREADTKARQGDYRGCMRSIRSGKMSARNSVLFIRCAERAGDHAAACAAAARCSHRRCVRFRASRCQ